MARKTIKLTEHDLHKVIQESVENILLEFKKPNKIIIFSDGNKIYDYNDDFFVNYTTFKHDYIGISKNKELFSWTKTENGIEIWMEIPDEYAKKIFRNSFK